MPFIRPAYALCALSLFAIAGHAQTTTPAVSTVVAFNISNPYGNLVRAADGALYGVAAPATAVAGGIVYRSAIDGSDVKTIYQLTPDDAFTPQGGLLIGSDGLLYGTTKYGRAGEANSTGTIFRLSTSGTGFTVLHRFQASPAATSDFSVINTDGALPEAELIEGTDGYLYGVARAGGPNGRGSIFKIAKDGNGFAVLHTFAANTSTTAGQVVNVDGAHPVGQLVQGADGYLYGTTSAGGTNGNGTVFRIAFDGAGFQVLRQFSATVKDAETGFAENSDGAAPQAGLTNGNDGLLYGVTSSGGTNGLGVIFSITPDGSTYTVMHTFAGPDGAAPSAELLLGSDGKLYAATAAGGVDSNGETTSFGTIFSIDRAGTGFARLYSFDGSDGTTPATKLLEISSGRFIGTASAGGRCGYGTIYNYSAAGDEVDGNTKCGSSNNNDNGGGSTGAGFLVLLGGLAWARRRLR
jgi:uncharacterized repeat protein (TIGR03803 family)